MNRVALRDIALVLAALLVLGSTLALALHQVRQHPWAATAGEMRP